MAKPLVTDALWERIEPLLPPPKPRRFRFPGRKPIDDRKCLDRHPLRAQDRHPLGGPALRDGLRLRHDLLATAAGLAGRRYLGQAPRGSLDRAGGGRQDRLVAGPDRQQLRAGPRRRGQDRPQPRGPGQAGSKHHVITDASGIPLAATDRGQRQRCDPLAPLFNADPAGARQGGPPEEEAATRCTADLAYDSEPNRRQLSRRGIRPFCPRKAIMTAAGEIPLAGGADAVLAPRLSAGSGSARTVRPDHPSGVPHNWLCDDLSKTFMLRLILLGPLKVASSSRSPFSIPLTRSAKAFCPANPCRSC